jgi:hypothetical protein
MNEIIIKYGFYISILLNGILILITINLSKNYNKLYLKFSDTLSLKNLYKQKLDIASKNIENFKKRIEYLLNCF